MPFIQDCEIIENTEVAPDHFRLEFSSQSIAKAAQPGQFCMLQVQDGYFPLLRRPMSFEQIFKDRLTVLYKIEGEGTRMLSRLQPGRTISVQGPLGCGFPIEDRFDRHIIVAGGIGVAPFPALTNALMERINQKPEVILAARSKNLILDDDEFIKSGCKVHLATDDGSLGTKAYAAQMLEQLEPGPKDRVYVCGPMIMMATTSEVAVNAGADCLVALEAQMACGDGACLGCVVESTKELEGEKMIRVCCDGPVFDTRLVDWHAHNMAYDR